MLFVKTEVRPSTIQGLGLFAAEDIPEGTLIAQFDRSFGWCCDEDEFANLPPIAKQFIERYGWRGHYGGWRFCDIDDSRFMNHSSTPNMSVSTERGFTAKAARNIAVGEELTEDYKLFDPDFLSYGKDWK